MKGCTDYTEEASGWVRPREGKTKFRLRRILVVLGVLALIGFFVFTRLSPAETFSVDAEPAPSASAVQPPGTEEETPSQDPPKTDKEKDVKLIVYLTGAVASPGIFELGEGSRINDAVSDAGGLREDAAAEYLNLAARVEDGMHIHIPTREEIASGESARIEAAGATGVTDPPGGGSSPADTGPVNINKADKTELETLPGIGAALAQRIIDYREKNGLFAVIEDLKQVSGIGDKKFEDLADKVCV
jgi:competence protein ComEA